MASKPIDGERPDVFGPYFSGMENIHKEVLKYIKATPGVRQETVMTLLQCNFAEYVGEHHDSNYKWQELCFEGDFDHPFAVGINRQRMFSESDRKNHLISMIASAWEKHGFCRPTATKEIPGVTQLANDPWEMILSVHFYFSNEYCDDQIPDTQYFKVVYTRSSLVRYLDRIRLT